MLAVAFHFTDLHLPPKPPSREGPTFRDFWKCSCSEVFCLDRELSFYRGSFFSSSCLICSVMCFVSSQWHSLWPSSECGRRRWFFLLMGCDVVASFFLLWRGFISLGSMSLFRGGWRQLSGIASGCLVWKQLFWLPRFFLNEPFNWVRLEFQSVFLILVMSMWFPLRLMGIKMVSFVLNEIILEFGQ